MGKYLKEFELISQYEEYINSDMAILPNVSIIKDDTMVHYNPKVPNYLKFTAEEDNSTISLYGVTSPDIKYSLNGGDWTQWNYSAITLNMGDTVCMKGNNSNGFSTGNSTSTRLSNQFRMTGKIGASGNIMSLLYEDEFEGKLTIPCDYCFADMFFSCISLTTTPELPATTLTFGCYEQMFANCTSLTTAPELPATTLADYCYYNMFNGCTSLTTAPELPATTLVYCCYIAMFRRCTSLTTGPELPATTLADYCYQEMFSGCTNLNYIKMLATDISADGCLETWVNNVSSTGTFVKDPNMTSLPTGASGIPHGWDINGIDYKKFSIVNNSNNEIVLYHNNGVYSPIKGNYIDLSDQYDENTIYSFTTEINIYINIYKVSQDNISISKLSNIIWESGISLRELCNTYNINNLDGIIIFIYDADNIDGGGYGYDDYSSDNDYNGY